MKLSDFFIDLEDLIGRLIPGFVLLLNIFVFFDDFHLFISSVNHFDNHAITALLLIIATYVLGDFNSFISFSARQLFPFSTAHSLSLREFLQKRDPTSRLLKFYRQEFGEDILERHYREIHYYCKKAIVDGLPRAFGRIKRIEATVNYKICMFLPMAVTGVHLLITGNLLFSIAILLIALSLLVSGARLSREEMHLIYLTYYFFKSNGTPPSNQPVE